MANAIIEIFDAADETVGIKLTFGPNGTEPASAAHHAAVVALEAIGHYLKAESESVEPDPR